MLNVIMLSVVMLNIVILNTIRSIENYLLKSCSALAPKMLVKLTQITSFLGEIQSMTTCLHAGLPVCQSAVTLFANPPTCCLPAYLLVSPSAF
jgi:hypothetical protein